MVPHGILSAWRLRAGSCQPPAFSYLRFPKTNAHSQVWKDYQDKNKDRFLNEMLDLLRIPSVSARSEHKTDMVKCAEMIIYGGLDDATALNSGAKYNPAGAGTWTAISTTNGPSPAYDHAASWVGPTMVVTGGVNGTAGPSASYYVYDAGTTQWIYSGNFTDYNDKKYNHNSFYTGNMVIIWGGYNGNFVGTNTGYRYFLADIVSSASFNVPDETMYLYQKD